MRKVFTLWRSRKLDSNGIEGGSLTKFMWSTRKAFTLTEMLVVIAILALLSRLLTPYLRKTLETARQVTCAKNLKTLGTATFLHLDDNDDFIPPEKFKIALQTERPRGMASDYDDGRSAWWQKYNLGMYLFPNTLPPNNLGRPQTPLTVNHNTYRNHPVHSCPSAKYNSEHLFPSAYWVNTEKVTYLPGRGLHQKAWTNCQNAFSMATNENDEYYGRPQPYIKTSIQKIRTPSQLISMVDAGQSRSGQTSSAGGDLLKSVAGNPIAEKIGGIVTPLAISTQNHLPYEEVGTQTYDFRHNEAVNALFFDGHVSEQINGTIPSAYIQGE